MAAGVVLGYLRYVLGFDTIHFRKNMTQAERDLVALQKSFQKKGAQLQAAGRKLTVGLTLPIAAVGAASAKAFSNFEAGMSNVATLIDTSTESMRDMGREVLDVARRTPVAMGDLTSALYDVRSAGISAGDAMKVLEGSARLGVAGLGSTKEAVDLVTSSINAFNLQGEEQARIYDLIFKTVQSGKTNISQLAQGFGAVAGTVANAGIKIDEYLASVAAMTTTGLPAAQAHTQLRAAIAGLTRDTKETAAVFKALGAENFPDLIVKSGGMVQAFQRIREQLGGSDSALLKLVGSTEAMNAILGLTGNQNEAFTDTLANMRDGADAVGGAFDKQSKTAAARAQEMRNKLEAAAISIGELVIPVLSKLGDWAGRAAEAFNRLSPEAQKMVVWAGAFVAAAGPVLWTVGTMMKLLVPMLPLIKALGPVWTALGSGLMKVVVPALGAVSKALLSLMMNPYVLAAAAVILGIYLAWKNWDKIVAIVKRVYEGVKTWMIDKLGAVWETVKRGVDSVIDPFRRFHQAVVGNSYIPDLVDGIAYHMARLDGVMVAPVRAAAARAAEAFAELEGRVKALLDRLFPETARHNQFVRDLADLEEYARRAGWSVETLAKAIRELKNEYSPGLGGGDDGSMMETGAIIGPDLKDYADRLWDDVVIPTRQASAEVIRAYGEMAAGAIGAMKDMVSAFKSGDILGGIQIALNAVLHVLDALGRLKGGGFGGGAGGYSPPPFGGFRARGGPVVPGKSYIVGENGPEYLTVNRRGYVHPGKGGGGARVEIVPSPYFDAKVQGEAAKVVAPMVAYGAVASVVAAEARIHRRASRNFYSGAR